MTSEKTDEEKLRQELEGGVIGVKKPSGSVSKKKNLRSRSKTNSRRKDLTDVIDTFMEDFERRVEDSLNPKTASVPKDVSKVKVEPSISDLEELLTPSPLPEEVPVVPENEVLIEEAEGLEEPAVVEAEPETLPEENPEPVIPEPEELPEIPVVEEETSELPDIPVILPEQGDDDDEDFQELLTDDFEEPEEPVKPDEPDESEAVELPELQETELVEAQEPDDEFADILDDNEPVDEQPALDFSPAADVVVNVDEVLPEIQKNDEAPVDPESEAAPVAVTMPESTKTAEDKLMADIAEAMTGNPLSLETNDAGALYNLPENFLADGSSQSAEDKLKANIAQALSESPIATAQSQSQQDLEQELSTTPFDEITIPNYEERREPEIVEDEHNEPEELEEPEEDEQPFDVPVEVEVEDENEVEDEVNEEAEAEHEPEDDSPFDVPVEVEDSQVEVEAADEAADEEAAPVPVPEPEPEPEPELEAESEPESEEPQDIDDFADLPFSLGDDDEQEQEEPEPEPEQPEIPDEPATEQEALSQFVNTNLNEEAKMPEESLLDDVEQENDEWDMSSLGELGEAAIIHDDEPVVPETVTEMITKPETEEDHKEKTMGIREKLALRKNANSEEKSAKKKSSSSGGGGFLMPFVLILLLIVGSLILWQLTQMSNKLTSFAMNSAGFESGSVNDAPNPSYDYAIDFILDPNLTERMSQRGRAGWQVVGSRRTQDSTTGQYGYEFIFMRRTPGR